jgi:putative glycosyltransferase (TIGR04348 family)
MKIRIVTPMTTIARTGNCGTANQWVEMLQELGHDADVGAADSAPVDDGVDILIAVHGKKSHAAITHFHQQARENGTGKLVVALAGTDIYPEPDDDVLDSMAIADRLVVYQSKALEKIPAGSRGKAVVIPQSAVPAKQPGPPAADHFEICVVGHLREVKDPMRAAAASRMLPTSSNIRIIHAGGILDEKYRDLVERETSENPRYRFLGELDEEATAQLIATSRALVLSSFSEGGARVAGEAFANRTPVISSRIDGVLGLVGTDDYPGFFPFGDTAALADMMQKLETDTAFRAELISWADQMAPKFEPALEKEALRKLIAELN